MSATFAGRRVAVFLTRNGLVGLDPATGQVRFQRNWRARQAASVNAATPIVLHTIGFCIDAKHSLNQPGRILYRQANDLEELRRGLQNVLAEAPSFTVLQFGTVAPGKAGR